MKPWMLLKDVVIKGICCTVTSNVALSGDGDKSQSVADAVRRLSAPCIALLIIIIIIISSSSRRFTRAESPRRPPVDRRMRQQRPCRGRLQGKLPPENSAVVAHRATH